MRKLRTRQHVLEYLSHNYVEKQVLLGFCVFERCKFREYSYDATVFTFDDNGEIEPDLFFVQVKSTDRLRFSEKNKGYEIPLDKRDLNLWLDEIWPVVLVLYDGKTIRLFTLSSMSISRKTSLFCKKSIRTKPSSLRR